MENIEIAKTVINDIETYKMMRISENYKNRLKEAYDYIKSIGIKDVNDFTSREGMLIGAFTYNEITIFDRLNNSEYLKLIREAGYDYRLASCKKNPDSYGDKLASWGKLGKTPDRENLIKQGMIVEGLTAEEFERHF